MKYYLVIYENLKLLVKQGSDLKLLVDQLDEIERLEKKVNSVYLNSLNIDSLKANNENIALIKKERSNLYNKIGYEIIGVPFTENDAELYAIDKKLDYQEYFLFEIDKKDKQL